MITASVRKELNITFIITGSINVLDSCICYCRCITPWLKFFCTGIQIDFFLLFHFSDWNWKWNSKGYNSWIGRARQFVPTCIWTALTTSSFPAYIWETIPVSQLPLFFDSHLIITISPVFTFPALSLWLRLCLSRSATRYSGFHLFHAFSLHRCTSSFGIYCFHISSNNHAIWC